MLYLAPVLGEIAPRAFVSASGARRSASASRERARGRGGQRRRAARWSFAPAELAGVAAAFVGEDDLHGQDDLVARLAAAVPIVVFTRGADGCEVITGGRHAQVGVFPAREVDPTGAGDVFAAGVPVRARARRGAGGGGSPRGSGGVDRHGGGRGETLGRVGEAFERVRQVPVMARNLTFPPHRT